MMSINAGPLRTVWKPVLVEHAVVVAALDEEAGGDDAVLGGRVQRVVRGHRAVRAAHPHLVHGRRRCGNIVHHADTCTEHNPSLPCSIVSAVL